MEIRLIEWVDSLGSQGGWEPLEDIKTTRPMYIRTVGFVVDEGEDYITILQSYDERKDGRPHGDHYICIPKFAIQSQETVGVRA